MSTIYFSQVQHPVGQGGFHTGCLLYFGHPIWVGPMSIPQAGFAWAYDCGSDQGWALTVQIGKVCGASFNVLFISHLDSDHVDGVDELLLAASGIDEVVLPYLGDEDWALHLAASVSAGTISGSFIDLVADPAGWFGARGVKRITYVEAMGDEDDEVNGPDPIEPIRPGPGDGPQDVVRSDRDFEPMEIGWSRPPRVLQPADSSSARAETGLAPRGAVATVSVAGHPMNWVLSPFAFRPPAAKMLLFQKKLDRSFGAGLKAKDYADFARSSVGRENLRNCFDAVWKTHNLHSMALYAGPAIPTQGKVRNTAWHGKFVRRIIQPGWISMGDFDTTVKKRRDALLQYYSPYASMVGQLGLPHHGSDLSFDAGILAAFSGLACAIAAVGANGHGHPGAGVLAAVSATTSVDFVRVDEYQSSEYKIFGPVDS